MKLHRDNNSDSLNLIKAYTTGVITVNESSYQGSLIISPGAIVENWPPACHSDLNSEHCQQILDLGPEIILIGTGKRQHFPAPAILQPLINSGVGVEIMATDSACRTYNILAGEGRNVVAGLIVITAD
jgi:uncharacterized protein